MDWFNLVLVLLFIILPLIQQVVEQARRRNAPPEWEQEEGEWSEPVDGEALERPQAPRPRPETTPGGGWSEGWSQWPGFDEAEEDEEEQTTAVAIEPVSKRDTDIGLRAPVPVEGPVELPVPAPSPRPATPLRPAPVARPQQTFIAPRQEELLQVKRRTSSLPREVGEVRSSLRDPRGVRKALILREILNRPLSLRDLDPEG